MGARSLICRTDSQLVVGQMNGKFQVRDDQLLRYLHRVGTLVKDFHRCILKHIPREENVRADMLSKLHDGKEKGRLTTIIRQVLIEPSVECLVMDRTTTPDWRDEIKQLMKRQDDGQALKPADA